MPQELIHRHRQTIFDQAPVARRVPLIYAPACDDALAHGPWIEPPDHPDARVETVPARAVGEVELALGGEAGELQAFHRLWPNCGILQDLRLPERSGSDPV